MKKYTKVITLIAVIAMSVMLQACSFSKYDNFSDNNKLNINSQKECNNQASLEYEAEDNLVINQQEMLEDDDPYSLKNSIFAITDNFDIPLQNTVYGHTVKMNYFSSTTGKYRKADVLLPYDYNTSVKYPVLYLLHGLGGNNTSWEDIHAEYIVDNLVFNNDVPEMIIVCPNVIALPKVTDDMSEAEILDGFDSFIFDLQDSLMPFINKNFSVRQDRDGTAIAGYSYGAREALYIGFAMQDTFGYIGGFSPTSGVIPGVADDYDTPTLLNDFYVDPDIGDFHLILMDVGINDEEDCINATQFYGKTFEELGIDYISYYVDGGHDPGVWMNGLYNFVKRLFQY